ncbi:MAG: ATP-binding protein [Pseudomonadota bacterium]
MSSPSPIRGDPACPHCLGLGYVVAPGGPYAQASLCDCVPTCALCGGTGQRRVEHGGRVRVGRCRCRMLPDRIELFNRANIPARHAGSSFLSFRTEENPDAEGLRANCLEWVREYRPREENKGLILFGDVGRGKTHLLVAMLRELTLERGVEARFVEFSHLLSQLKEGYDLGTGEATTLTPLIRVPLLAIDELGKGRGTEWELGIIDQVVSHRYNTLGTILATTNYRPTSATGRAVPNNAEPGNPPTLGDRVGDRVLSRLREMCLVSRVSGDDYRPRMGLR